MSINSNYKMLQKFYTYRKCILTWTQILTLRAGDSRMALGQGLHSRMGGPSEDSHLFPFHSRMAPILTTRRTSYKLFLFISFTPQDFFNFFILFLLYYGIIKLVGYTLVWI